MESRVRRINIVRTMDSNQDNTTIITIIMIMTINTTNSVLSFADVFLIIGYVVLKRQTKTKSDENRRLHY